MNGRTTNKVYADFQTFKAYSAQYWQQSKSRTICVAILMRGHGRWNVIKFILFMVKLYQTIRLKVVEVSLVKLLNVHDFV